MSDAQRQRMQGSDGSSRDADTVGGGGAQAKRAEQNLGLEDVKLDGDGAAKSGESRPKPPAPPSASSGALTVHVVGRSDVGLVREHNEDNYMLADLATGSRDPSTFHDVPSAGLMMAVCDGMGGAAAGEVASQMAVDTIYEMMRRSVPAADRDAFARALVRAIEEAGARIFESARADRTRRGMGTTSTVAALMDKTLFVGQVGDSRAYILRSGDLKQVTKDQSLVNQLIEAGQLTEDEAEAFEHSNIILQALGTTEQVSVDLTFLELRRGDRLLMCSDGLSGLVHGDVIREVMVEYKDLGACCERLIELAKAGGGHDNVTVLLCDFGGEGLALPRPSDLAGYQQYPLPIDESDPEDSGPISDVPTLAPPSGRAHERDSGHRFEGDDAASGTGKSSALRALMLIVFLGLVAAAYWYTMGGGELKLRSEAPAPTVASAPVAPPPPARVEVVVRTDVEGGELFVDGESYGVATENRWVIDLLPGPHKLDARAGGSSVTSTLVTVREGVPATVLLSMPEGAGGTAADAGSAVPERSGAKRAPRREHVEGSDVPDDLGQRHRRRRDAVSNEPSTTPSPTPAPEAFEVPP